MDFKWIFSLSSFSLIRANNKFMASEILFPVFAEVGNLNQLKIRS